MPTRNVVITDRQAALIEKLVEGGEYQNASEVLREGLRLVEERRIEYAVKLQTLRAAVQQGRDDLEAGLYTPFESADALADHLRLEADRIIADVEKGQGAEI